MAAFHSGDKLDAVVADVGSWATKIGWAGDDSPRSYFRSNVAVLKEEQASDVAESGATSKVSASSSTRQERTQQQRISKVNYDYYSSAIDSKTHSDGEWKVSNPVNSTTGLWYDSQSDTGADWYDLLQHFLNHGYETALAASSVSEHPLLLAERSYTPPAVRQQVMECLFEEMQVPCAFLAKDAVLSCYGCGRTTATVIDMGYSGTTVTPVYDGYAETKGIRRSPAGVQAMDELILEQLDALYTAEQRRKKKAGSSGKHQVMPFYQVRPVRAGYDPAGQTLPRKRRAAPFHAAARLQIAQECRQLGAGAAINMTKPVDTGNANAGNNNNKAATAFHAPHKPFALPDGTTVLDVPSANRFAAADFLLGNDPASVERRQALLEQCQQELTALVEQATAKTAKDADGDVEMADSNKPAAEAADHTTKYSAEAAVGISKRRTKRGAAAAAGSSSTNKQAPTADATKESNRATTSFDNRLLRAACAPVLQTLLDDQLTALPVASMVCDSAYRCDRDQQAALLGNVVLGGGGACLGPTDQAVPDLIREQVEAVIHAHTAGWRVKVLTPNALPERSILSWLGGSILGSLGTFHELWITAAEYEEWGPAIVNRKCP